MQDVLRGKACNIRTGSGAFSMLAFLRLTATFVTPSILTGSVCVFRVTCSARPLS